MSEARNDGPSAASLVKGLVQLGIGAGVVAFVGSLFVAAPDTPSSGSTFKHMIGDRVQISEELWACDNEAWDRLDHQHDREAFRSLMSRLARAKRCFPVKPGSVVDVTDVSLFKSRTKVRFRGKPDDWWLSTGRLDVAGSKVGSWSRP